MPFEPPPQSHCGRPVIVRRRNPGHHTKTIESLELTTKADSKLIQRMKNLSRKRNATSYDSAGNVSKQELELAIRTAAELHRDIVTWVEKNHPELLKD
jgi:predicted Rossmann fold nucleotide-binding protein DprA/Smf involved in DNA uptake